MNDPKNKAVLGVNPEQTFASCNMAVNQGFMMQGDGAHNSAALLPDLVNSGIRLLVYAGDAGVFSVYQTIRPTVANIALVMSRYDVQLYSLCILLILA